MELLKFNDAPKSPRRGKNPAGFIGAGIMVAVMGLSSTLAGTITIGSGSVEFGQGIVTASACDGSITLTPTSKLVNVGGTDLFQVSDITLSAIGVYSSGTTIGACAGKVLEIRAYASGTTPIQFNSDTSTTLALVVKIPATAPGAGWADSAAYGTAKFFNVVDSAISGSSQGTTTIDATGSTAALATTADTGLSLKISGLSLSGTVTKFTVESRAPRDGE